MEETQISKSAAVVAAHRAIESARPPDQRICYDPIAGHLLAKNMTVIGETDMPPEQALVLWKQFIPGFHEYFLARTRYIDDFLEDFIKEGMQQLVILGAGYDSRAYRFDALVRGIPVFEVDHPGTQAIKKEKLGRLPDLCRDHVTYVPLDFKESDLGTPLFENGYDPKLKTLFIWEGVTMYLPRETVETVLSFVAADSAPGSALIFDVTTPEVIQGTDPHPEAVAWKKKVDDTSEPLRFGISEIDLKSLLEKHSCGNIRFVTHDDFKQAYFSRPGDDRSPTPILAVVHAVVSA